MKKIAKLSLVAAMAVTAANAAALEEAIKNVDVSGKLYVEHMVGETNDNGSVSGFEIDADINLKAKINDNLTANVGVEADTKTNEETKTEQAGLKLDDAYFTYSNAGATVKMGRMGISTPNTDGEKGEGFLAAYTMGPVTAVAAHFVNNSTESPFADNALINGVTEAAVTTLMQGSDVNAAALLGSVGPVNLEAWYVDVSAVADNYTFVAAGSVAGVNLGARYATTEFKNAAKAAKDGKTYILTASGKVANVGLRAVYLNNDEDNAALTTDSASANTIELVNFNAQNSADTKAYVLGVTVPVVENVNFDLDYGWADIGDNTEASEVVAKVSYKMAKSTTLTARYADMTTETTGQADEDKTQARLDITYKF